MPWWNHTDTDIFANPDRWQDIGILKPDIAGMLLEWYARMISWNDSGTAEVAGIILQWHSLLVNCF